MAIVTAAVVLLLGGTIVIAPVAGAVSSLTSKDIGNLSSPLTHIYVGNDLSCQVGHMLDAATLEFDPSNATLADCGTFLVVGGTLYGPDFAKHSSTSTSFPGGITPFTDVSQRLLGAGSAADPLRVVTNVSAGSTGVTIQQTDSYEFGQASFRTQIMVQNSTASPESVTLYRAGDCFLEGSDTGQGVVVSSDPKLGTTIGCTPASGPRVEEWVPLTKGSHYLEDTASALWNAIDGHGDLANACACSNPANDNAAGLSWTFAVPAAAGSLPGSVMRADLSNFSSTGKLPLLTSKAADMGAVGAGASDGYTITFHDSNGAGVTLASISDMLPAGFTYTPGSTTGLSTADPNISGQTLTWNAPVPGTVAAGSDATLHFAVTVASPGTQTKYSNSAWGTATGYDVIPTGGTAPVTVTSGHTLTVTPAGSGSGKVTSSPPGIDCPPTCSNTFAEGTLVGLSAVADSGSTFGSWGGDCNSSPCQVTMTADHAATATFNLGVCGQIVFSSHRDGNNEIYVMNSDGRSQTDLTKNPASDTQPAWSPDCSQIAFTSNRDGNNEIYVMNADGMSPTPLTTNAASDTQPAWSPDGSTIAFVSDRRSGNTDIWTMSSTDGSGVRRLTRNAAVDTQPAWSPDGTKVAFVSRRTGNLDIFTMSATGTGATQLTTSSFSDIQPAWSPGRRRIAFASNRTGNYDVFFAGLRGAGLTQLTRGPWADSQPAWAPDGSAVAFVSNRTGDNEIFSMTSLGTGGHNLTQDATFSDSQPAWAP